MSIHSSLKLIISDAAYELVPATQFSDKSSQHTLVISRSSNRAQFSLGSPSSPKQNSPSGNSPQKVITGLVGLYGIISLKKTDYLILIKSAKRVTNVLETPVYTPTGFSIYPISLEPNQSLLAHSEERYLLSVLKAQIDRFERNVFYTYHLLPPKAATDQPIHCYDLTRGLQSQFSHEHALQGLPAWKGTDRRFFWNLKLCEGLINFAESHADHSPVHRFILPVIFGFLDFKVTKINGRPLEIGIISRRSRERVGTRYFSRGIDERGCVSNFNETEMIFHTTPPNFNNRSRHKGGIIAGSYLQTRGSVPVFWTEINNLRYKPDMKILNLPTTKAAFQTHFEKQTSIYGDQYCVNLVNRTGYEKPIKEAYERLLEMLGNPQIHYIYFDFHQECKGLRFDRVSKLIDTLKDELESNQGYFLLDQSRGASQETRLPDESDTKGSLILKRQVSVVRTNCMDCLDRTNVVQSALALWTLGLQLKQAGILTETDSLDLHPDFMHLFRNLWADNADSVSKAYSGTGALKTDFTRYGVRTKQGAFQDLLKSLTRYILNNFTDGGRQDGFDLITGNWCPNTKENFLSSDKDVEAGEDMLGKANEAEFGSRLLRDNPLHQLVVLILVISFLIFISATFTKKRRSMKLWLTALAMMVICLSYMMCFGREFIDLPRLHSRKYLLEFEGSAESSCYQSSVRGNCNSQGLLRLFLGKESPSVQVPRRTAGGASFLKSGNTIGGGGMSASGVSAGVSGGIGAASQHHPHHHHHPHGIDEKKVRLD